MTGKCQQNLDTHALIWFREANQRLGPQARREIELSLGNAAAAVSVISFWEIAMQLQKGRIVLPLDLASWRQDLLEYGLTEIPVTATIASRAGFLPDMHGDPCDRLIVATAIEGHELITADERILSWPGQLTRLDARQ